MQTTTPEIATQPRVTHAAVIPDVTREEARELSLIEIERVVALLERLDGDDWDQPTDCSEWTVRAMAAHLSGACRGWADWKHFRRQYIFNPYARKGEDLIDGINRCEVADRVNWSTEDVIAEMREYGPKAVKTRQRIPQFICNITLPIPPLGQVPIRYLLDIIYHRDQWMHRGDICRATGWRMFFTKAYDERVTDLVMLDVAQRFGTRLQGTVDVNITGGIEKTYRFGTKPEADATITIDVLEFNRRASFRSTVDEVKAVSTIEGDESIANWFLENFEAGY
jgi:uncharacterized protein (TIGR03083 family)